MATFKIIDLYLLRIFGIRFLLALSSAICLGFLICIVRFSYLISKNINLSDLFYISSLEAITFASPTAVVCLSLSVIYSCRHMITTRQLIVCANIGMSRQRISYIVLGMSIIVAICSSLVRNTINYQIQDLIQARVYFIQNTKSAALIQSKTFNMFNSKFGLYFQKRNKDGTFENLIIFDQNEESRVFVAQRGTIHFNQDMIAVTLINGDLQTRQKGTISSARFKDLTINIPLPHYINKTSTRTYSLYLDIYYMLQSDNITHQHLHEALVEFINRIFWPFYCVYISIAVFFVAMANVKHCAILRAFAVFVILNIAYFTTNYLSAFNVNIIIFNILHAILGMFLIYRFAK